MRIVNLIVRPATGFLAAVVIDDLKLAVSIHRLPKRFKCCFAVINLGKIVITQFLVEIAILSASILLLVFSSV
mgnify:CR=1 FL=1